MDVIRKFETSDLEAIYSIYCFYVKNSVAIFDIQCISYEVFKNEMLEIASEYPFYVAYHEDELIGYGYVHAAFSKEAYKYCVELTIYFAQGKHYGMPGKLVDQLEEDCKRLNMRWIISCITDTNAESIRFHEKRGYEKMGFLPSCGLKFDVWHGVIWMCKNLMESNSYSISSKASVSGDVCIGKKSKILDFACIRGDSDSIKIGECTNIQENCVLHVDHGYPLTIGNRVTVGHGAILHGCEIADEVLIGMGAIVLNGAKIGKHSIIGAGALISENMQIPNGSVVVGVPGKIIKQVSAEQIEMILENEKHYSGE